MSENLQQHFVELCGQGFAPDGIAEHALYCGCSPAFPKSADARWLKAST